MTQELGGPRVAGFRSLMVMAGPVGKAVTRLCLSGHFRSPLCLADFLAFNYSVVSIAYICFTRATFL